MAPNGIVLDIEEAERLRADATCPASQQALRVDAHLRRLRTMLEKQRKQAERGEEKADVMEV